METATRKDLDKLGVTDMSLAQAAILMARHADGATSSTAAAQAARELRMTMSQVRGLVTWIPPVKADDDPGGTVIPQSRLEAARQGAASRGRKK